VDLSDPKIDIFVPISLREPARQYAFGFANVFRLTDGTVVVDSQNHKIDTTDAIAAIENAVYEYVLTSRSGDEQHINYGVARLIETVVLNEEKRGAFAAHAAYHELGSDADTDDLAALTTTKLTQARAVLPDAWWVGFKIDDDDAWEKTEDGTYPMFSIVGRGRSIENA
jgi:hypothetical protein